MTLTVFLALLVSLLSLAAAEDHVAVNIAAAYNSAAKDGWARYVYWQHPNGKIMIQQRLSKANDTGPQQIKSATPAKAESPLAALYRPTANPKYKGAHDLFLSYLDTAGQIVDCTCRYQNGEYLDWSTNSTGITPASGLALADVGGTRHRFYVDDKDFIVENVGAKESQLGPVAAKGSRVAASVPVGSTDIHVFFVAKDETSLASLTFDGSQWVESITAIPNFTSKEKSDIGFAAVAWSDPLIVKIFHISDDNTASEWTFTDGSWTDTSKGMSNPQGTVKGDPVAASRSVNGSGRYIEYFYSTTTHEIDYLAQLSPTSTPFQVKLAEFEVETPAEPKRKLTNEAIIGLALGLATFVLALLTLYYARKAIVRSNASQGLGGRWPKTKAVFGSILRVPKPRGKGHGAGMVSSGSSTAPGGNGNAVGRTVVVAQATP
ncbi:hypothetical protein V492_06206 [Pseudogymnoascus sp. VKM F-4246]|nr:hypothetical protein V492_06206 [Pseudogymnoascus sp. VKM F-4246]